MKNQILILNRILKSKQIYYLLLLYLFFLILIINYVLLFPSEINNMSYEIILGNYKIFNFNFVCMLWLLFQSLLIIYIQFTFLIYEFDNSLEFTILRESLLTIIIKKIIIIVILDVLFKLFMYFLCYVVLSSHSININIIISNELYTLFLSFISFILFILFNFNYNRK